MSLTFQNNTTYDAQYVVKKGDQIIARLPGLLAGGSLTVPTNEVYEVTAMTLIDGNSYTSAPLSISGSMGFLAQVLQVPTQGTYEFDVQQFPSPQPNHLQFQKTCLNPVTFTITHDGRPLQSVVVNDSFDTVSLDISDTFHIYAVINGVTTATLTTNNANAVITATVDTTIVASGYFSLTES